MQNFKEAFAHTGDEDFPATTSKNSSGGGASDGTHFNKTYIDDFWGFAQACLSQGGLTPSGVSESYNASQILEGIVNVLVKSDTVAVSISTFNADVNNGVVVASTTARTSISGLSRSATFYDAFSLPPEVVTDVLVHSDVWPSYIYDSSSLREVSTPFYLRDNQGVVFVCKFDTNVKGSGLDGFLITLPQWGVIPNNQINVVGKIFY